MYDEHNSKTAFLKKYSDQDSQLKDKYFSKDILDDEHNSKKNTSQKDILTEETI